MQIRIDKILKLLHVKRLYNDILRFELKHMSSHLGKKEETHRTKCASRYIHVNNILYLKCIRQ